MPDLRTPDLFTPIERAIRLFVDCHFADPTRPPDAHTIARDTDVSPGRGGRGAAVRAPAAIERLFTGVGLTGEFWRVT